MCQPLMMSAVSEGGPVDFGEPAAAHRFTCPSARDFDQ